MLPHFGPFAVYFSFADGAIGYHCHECGYRCCHGQGFGATHSELVELRRHYPILPMFVQPQRDPEAPLIGIRNFMPRCYFLRDDGNCRIEVEVGRQVKPYVCRTFPVNQLQRFGVILVAELHFMCPLRPLRDGDRPVQHADVTADLQRSIEVPMQLPSEAEDSFPEALLVHESFLRDLPIDDDLLGRLALADVMAPRWARAPQAPSAAFVAPHRAYLAGLRREMIALLGLEDAVDAERPRHTRELELMLPRLRLALLRLRPPSRSLDELLPQLGRRMLAVSVYLELMSSLGGEITLGAIDQAFRYAQIFCEMLSQADRVPILIPGDDSYELTLYKTQEAAMQRFLRFVHDENPRRCLTLHEVLREIDLHEPSARAQLCQSFTQEALPRFRFEARS